MCDTAGRLFAGRTAEVDLHSAFGDVEIDLRKDGFGVLSASIREFDASHFDGGSLLLLLRLPLTRDWRLERVTSRSVGTQRDVAEALVVDFDCRHAVAGAGGT